MQNRRSTILIQTLIVIAILLLLNVISRNLYTFLDLTEDKRYTLTNATETLLDDVNDVIYIDVLLAGDLPSGYKRLQNRTEEVIKQLKAANPLIEFKFTDPSEGSVKDINARRENLAKDGIYPSNLIVMENDQKVEKLIYPFALMQLGPRNIAINLLDGQIRGENQEVWLNRSANNLEYKFASAIEKLFKDDIPIVLFTDGNGELMESQTATLEQGISGTMNSGRINLDSVYQIKQDVDLLIVARPKATLSTRSKFLIDQYIMNGGKVMWFVESLDVNLDSINMNNVYIPRPIEHGLDDMFFKYGVRMKKDLVLDLENSKIPQVIGQAGNRAQQELFNWVYYPLLQSSNDHPIVNNIDRVYSNFPGSIELLDTKLNLTSKVLLNSSQYSRFQLYPMRLSFEIIKMTQKPEAFNKPKLPTAVLVEGEFESFFKNRVTEEMANGLQQIGAEFKDKSSSTSQIFVSDVDIIKNLYSSSNNKISPLGFNQWEGMVYGGNAEFITNAIDYMTDEYGLMESRSKNLQLRMLDQVKLKNERLKWQVINLALPIVLVLLFGLFFNWNRKRKFAS